MIRTPRLVFAVLSICLGQSLFAQTKGLPHHPLDDEARHPLHVKADLSTSPAGYAVPQIRHAYGFDQLNGSGAGQVIAIVDAYGSPSIQADLNTFSSAFGLPAATLRIYYPQGQPAANSGWALETSLDVEWAHAMAPSATIVLVVAQTPTLSNLLNAVDYAVSMGATQVSMSWGSSEFSSEANYDYHFNHPGVTFFASSGDMGAGVNWPASSPYVLGVGGTTLALDSNGSISSETGWSGSGGGSSAYESRPVFQNAWQTSTGRAVPDVSYNADPETGFGVYISNYNGSTGWIEVGGTSAGAPQWAALAADIKSVPSSTASGTVAEIYSFATANYAKYYRDITSGSNGAFHAIAGFDFVTGLGSPVVNAFTPTISSVSVAIGNSGFENPSFGSTSHTFAYDPTVGSAQTWSFVASAGISSNGSAFTAGNSAAPEGTQVAFLQSRGSFSQTITLPATANYQLTFSAAQRGNSNQAAQTVLVYIGSMLVGSVTPSGSSYQTYTVRFSANAGAYTLKLGGNAAVDATAFVDNIKIVSVP